ncbi:TfoX/Sxy family protein [Ahniella affigens]|uniref:TfoX/Sxy family protein n=1 Tax=Ahniella affigens TaxID=2021234 RepID=UPI0014763C81|nr:TfoX/Sxy family protein [Ahniella affigens]
MPALSLRRMFGGVGVFHDGQMFALSIEEQVYLKADADTEGVFQAKGLRPFTYEAKGKAMVIRYYELDAEAFEDPAVLKYWVQLAMGAALRKAKSGGSSARPKVGPKAVRKRSRA